MCLPRGMFWSQLTSAHTHCNRANAKRREKIKPVAVPLDTLPERGTMTIHPEISARESLIPTGNGSKLLSKTCPPTPGQGSEGGKSRPLDHMRQIPFLGSSVPPYYFD